MFVTIDTMKKILRSLFFLSCVSLVSCSNFVEDQIAMQLLMGRDSDECSRALGRAVEMRGTPENGEIKWFWDMATGDDYLVAETKITFSKNRAIRLHYYGDSAATEDAWRLRHDHLIKLHEACLNNDLEEVIELLTLHPELRQQQVILAAAAQAARYAAPQTCSYLVSQYKLDIHKTFVTWKYTDHRWSGAECVVRQMELVNTTLAALIEEGKKTYPKNYWRALN